MKLPTIPILALPADSVTRSPLYSIYGETISGVAVLRAFGASSKFLRDMLRCADTVGWTLSWRLVLMTESILPLELKPILLDVGR